MGLNSRVISKMELSKDRVRSDGPMEHLTEEISILIKLKVLGSTYGATVGSSQGTGKITRCMEMVFSNGRTADTTREAT